MKRIFCLILVLIIGRASLAVDRFVSGNTSVVFHKMDCRYASSLTKDNAEFFEHYQDAVDRGFRPCQICNPEPDPFVPEPDPNDTVVIPETPEPAILMPVPNLLIQSSYCRRAFNPDEVGTRIYNAQITETTYASVGLSEISTKEFPNGSCEFCGRLGYNLRDNVDPNFLTIIYDPNDPDSIIDWSLAPETPVYWSDASIYWHVKPDCEYLQSVRVKMINEETKVPAVCDAFWNPKKGTLEWRVTPFELGNYMAVCNSDVGQTQLAAITVRPRIGEFPTLEQFSEMWLRGNCNNLTYGQWLLLKQLFDKWSSRGATSIEWVFVDGVWKPVGSGVQLSQEEIHLQIAENTTYDKVTTRNETAIAPFEWKPTQLKVTEITTTNYDFDKSNPVLSILQGSGDTPLSTSTKSSVTTKSNKQPLTASDLFYQEEEYCTEEEFAASCGIAPPAKVAPPDGNAVLASIAQVKAVLGESSIANESISQMLKDYEQQKANYEAYKEEYKKWIEAGKLEIGKQLLAMAVADDFHMSEEWDLVNEEDNVMTLHYLQEDDRLSAEQKRVLAEIEEVLRESASSAMEEAKVEAERQRLVVQQSITAEDISHLEIKTPRMPK
jgi:hypothetical protein